jgi:hypothetical protein
MILSIQLNETGLTFSDAATNMGVRDLVLRLTIDGTVTDVRYDSLQEMAAEANVGGTLRVRTTVAPVADLDAVVLTHQLTNTSKRPVRVHAATGAFAKTSAVHHGKGSWLGWDLRYCHTDLETPCRLWLTHHP